MFCFWIFTLYALVQMVFAPFYVSTSNFTTPYWFAAYLPLVLSRAFSSCDHDGVRGIRVTFISLYSSLFRPEALYSSCSVPSIHRISTDIMMSTVKTLAE